MIRVRAEAVWFAYDGGEPALRGVDLTVEPGEFLALVGQNGSGKSTLARTLNGLLKPQRGRVTHDGAALEARTAAGNVAYVFQNPDHMLFARTVREELALGPRYLGLSESDVEERVERTLGEYGLREIGERGPASLDFGTRRTVSVAAALASEPAVVVLDEPTLGLDWGRAVELMDRIAGMNRGGHGVVLITHDMRLVARYARRVAVMSDGAIVEEGPVESVMRDTELTKRERLEAPQIVRLATQLGLEGNTIEAVCAELSRA